MKTEKGLRSLWLDPHFITESYKHLVLRTGQTTEPISFIIFSFHIPHWGWLALHCHLGTPTSPLFCDRDLPGWLFTFSVLGGIFFVSFNKSFLFPTVTFISECSVKGSLLKCRSGWAEPILTSFKINAFFKVKIVLPYKISTPCSTQSMIQFQVETSKLLSICSSLLSRGLVATASEFQGAPQLFCSRLLWLLSNITITLHHCTDFISFD